MLEPNFAGLVYPYVKRVAWSLLWFIDYIFNVEIQKVDAMRERRLERLRERAIRKPNPRKWLDAKIERIEQRQERLRGIAAITIPVADAIISVLPGGAIIGNALSRVIGGRLASKLPVLGDFVAEGASIVDAERKAGLNWPKIALRDFVPLAREIDDGDIDGIVFGLVLIIFVVYVII